MKLSEINKSDKQRWFGAMFIVFLYAIFMVLFLSSCDNSPRMKPLPFYSGYIIVKMNDDRLNNDYTILTIFHPDTLLYKSILVYKYEASIYHQGDTIL